MLLDRHTIRNKCASKIAQKVLRKASGKVSRKGFDWVSRKGCNWISIGFGHIAYSNALSLSVWTFDTASDISLG